MKDNLFPLRFNDMNVFFWTGNAQVERECTLKHIDVGKITVSLDTALPTIGTAGIFWRPFYPILPATITQAADGSFTAEFGELSEDARKLVTALIECQSGQVIPSKRRPGFFGRLIIETLFKLEQGLPDIHRRTFNTEEFPWSLEFERNYAGIRKEVENIFKNVNVSDIPLGPDRLATWHSVLVAEKGRTTEEAQALLPRTGEIVNRVPSLLNADLSILRPGAVIKYHKANSRTFLRMHLGIIIPQGDVCLQLEDQRLHWSEGKVMIFDDFFPHAAWNKTDQTRVILMVDFLRPMPTWKNLVIRFMHRMNAKPLPNIPRQWLKWGVQKS